MKYLKEVKNDSHTFIGEFLESEFDDYNLNFSLKAKYKTFFIKVFGIFILIKLNFSANMISCLKLNKLFFFPNFFQLGSKFFFF